MEPKRDPKGSFVVPCNENAQPRATTFRVRDDILWSKSVYPPAIHFFFHFSIVICALSPIQIYITKLSEIKQEIAVRWNCSIPETTILCGPQTLGQLPSDTDTGYTACTNTHVYPTKIPISRPLKAKRAIHPDRHGLPDPQQFLVALAARRCHAPLACTDGGPRQPPHP